MLLEPRRHACIAAAPSRSSAHHVHARSEGAAAPAALSRFASIWHANFGSGMCSRSEFGRRATDALPARGAPAFAAQRFPDVHARRKAVGASHAIHAAERLKNCRLKPVSVSELHRRSQKLAATRCAMHNWLRLASLQRGRPPKCSVPPINARLPPEANSPPSRLLV